MSSEDFEARKELMSRLRDIYSEGSGTSGGGMVGDYQGGKGTKAGAAAGVKTKREGEYGIYLKEYKGVKRVNRPPYKLWKKARNSRPKAVAKKRERERAAKDTTDEMKELEKIMRIANIARPLPPAPGEPRSKSKKPLNKSLKFYTECLKEFRDKHPDIPYREAQQIVKKQIDIKRRKCNTHKFEEARGGVLLDFNE